jgi:hypothetical protein
MTTVKPLARNKPVPHATSRRRAQAIIADAERYDSAVSNLGPMGPKPENESQARELAAQFRTIAEHIAAILQNPLTPERLYLGIVDGLMNLNTDISTHESVGYVETILLVNDTRRQERKIS